MGEHAAKAALFDALTEAAKALANGRRAELVDVLAQGERSVEELAGEIDQSVANTSHHLQRLLRAGLARDYLGDRGSLETITRDELAMRLRAGDVVVLDVRPAAEYDAGHLPGAISLPVAQLRDRLDEVRSGAEIVAYCRGPYCVYADDAVRLLTANGRTAYRLEDGFPEWSMAGLPVEH